jgi:hypothetical protein
MSLTSDSKLNFALEIKIMLQAYITMDFGVIDCNYEIFSICQKDTGEKLREIFETTANYLHTLKRQQYSTITSN